MLKVLLVHNYYQQPGGEDQVVADEAWLLEKAGCEVVRYHRHNDEIQGNGGLKTAAATLWNRQTYRELRALIRREHPDVMHCHNLFPLISPVAWQAAHELALPVVQTLHNFRWICAGGAFLRDGKACEDCLGRSPMPAVRHACYRGSCLGTAVVAGMQMWHRFRGSFDLVNRFIALSQFSRSKFIAGGLPSERITVKANFLTSEVEPGHGEGGNALFVGRLSEEKGLEVLLAAWRQLRAPLRLTIIGDGPLASQVQAAAAEDSRIEWLGRLPQDDVYVRVAQAGFLVLPSTCYENFPKTIVEAYAHGTPVLASDHGSLRELVTPGVTGYTFRPGDPADLTKQIETFPLAGREYARLRAEVRQTYLDRFTAHQNWRQLVSIYEEVLPTPPASKMCNSSSPGVALVAEGRETSL